MTLQTLTAESTHGNTPEALFVGQRAVNEVKDLAKYMTHGPPPYQQSPYWKPEYAKESMHRRQEEREVYTLDNSLV